LIKHINYMIQNILNYKYEICYIIKHLESICDALCYNRIQNKELSLEVLDSKYLNDR